MTFRLVGAPVPPDRIHPSPQRPFNPIVRTPARRKAHRTSHTRPVQVNRSFVHGLPGLRRDADGPGVSAYSAVLLLVSLGLSLAVLGLMNQLQELRRGSAFSYEMRD